MKRNMTKYTNYRWSEALQECVEVEEQADPIRELAELKALKVRGDSVRVNYSLVVTRPSRNEYRVSPMTSLDDYYPTISKCATPEEVIREVYK